LQTLAKITAGQFTNLFVHKKVCRSEQLSELEGPRFGMDVLQTLEESWLCLESPSDCFASQHTA